MSLRIAYLNTEYPSLTHTFIEREIRSVRASGVEVQPFSVRRPKANDTLSAAHANAARETCYLLGSFLRLFVDQVLGALRHPIRYVRAMLRSQHFSPPGIRARVYHLAYAMEGVRLAREMRKRGLSHVHVDMANNGAMTARLATVYDPRIGYSLTVHGPADFFNVGTGRLGVKVDGARFTRCISNFCRGQVLAFSDPEGRERLHVVHCGVDPEVFRPRPLPGGETFRMLAIGRLAPVKGYEITLEAGRMLDEAGVDWRLDLVGDGPSRARLTAMAARLGVADRVTFHGAVSQDVIQRHFDAAHALVVSSFSEGVPVVMMEAMAKELAVVATRIAGIPELVTDGENGLLVDASSADQLFGAIRRLAGDRELVARLGREGRRKVVAEFAHPGVGSEMAELFYRYLGGRPSLRAAGKPKPESRGRFAVVTPARDEEDHLPATIRSMAEQHVRPDLWVVVDDGSTDRTPEILEAAKAELPFLRVVRREDRGGRSVGPGVIDAFYAGLETVDLDDYEYVCKLDGDLELPPTYFESVIARFDADPLLGNFSGKVYFRDPDGALHYERMGDENAIGAAKFYRTACFREIGGFVREVSWDGLDGHMCRMNGWIASSEDLPEVRIIHRRLMGSSQQSVWTGRKRWGRGKWFMGSALYYVLAVAGYRLFEKPFLVGGIGILWGYVAAALRRTPRFPDRAVRRQLRRHERLSLFLGKRRATARLNAEIRAKKSSPPVMKDASGEAGLDVSGGGIG